MIAISGLSNSTIVELVTNMTPIGDTQLSNPNGAVIYSSGRCGLAFRDILNTVEITVLDGLDLDFEQNTSYQIEVRVDDVIYFDVAFLTINILNDTGETLTGDSEGRTFTADINVDNFTGGSGNENLSTGQGQNDTINGGGGNDSIQGAAGQDILFGDAGDDIITGGTGGDRLDGGSGNDTMNGGGNDGALDTYFFGEGRDQDRVNAYEQGTDRLELDDNLWIGTNGVLTEQQVIDTFGNLNGPGTILTLDFGGGDILEVQNAAGINQGTLGADVVIV